MKRLTFALFLFLALQVVANAQTPRTLVKAVTTTNGIACSPGPPQADEVIVVGGGSPGLYICDSLNHWALVTSIGVPGIFSINSDTHSSQTIAIGTAGNAPAVSTSAGTTTINIPAASATANGTITTGTQTIAGAKTLSGATVINNTLTASNIVTVNRTSLGTSSTDSFVLSNTTPSSGTAQNSPLIMMHGSKFDSDASLSVDWYFQTGLLLPASSAGNGNAQLIFGLRAGAESDISNPSFQRFIFDSTGQLTAQSGLVSPQLKLNGATSGTATIIPQAIAGTYTFKLPNTNPTVGQNVNVIGFSGNTVTLGYASAVSSAYEGVAAYDVQRDFGASGSKQTASCSIISGTNQLICDVASDFVVGDDVKVPGAKTGSKNLVKTINVIAGTTFTLSGNADLTVGPVTVTHDDSRPINTALSTIGAAGVGGAILFKKVDRNGLPGTYYVSGPIQSNCNSILCLPQTTRIAGSPVSIVLLGEVSGPLTGSNIVPTAGTIVDASSFNDSTITNYGAILSGKTYLQTGSVNDTTFNYIQLEIYNMNFRNKPNPDLSGINANNTEGLIYVNGFVDASQSLTFTSAAGFTINTQPTHTTAAGILMPGLNNIGQEHLERVTVTGHYYGFVVGDNGRFNGIYSIQNDTGLYCPGNAAMTSGSVGIYATKNPIVVTNTLGVQTTLNLDLESQVINTGAWYDVAANHLIYDPLNQSIGVVRGIMAGNPGSTGGANLTILDEYGKTYKYNSSQIQTPQFTLTNTAASSVGNQWVMFNDINDFGVMSLSGSTDVPGLRGKLNLYAKKDIIINAGFSASGMVRLQSASTDILTADSVLGVAISKFVNVSATVTVGKQTIALAAGGSTAIDMTVGNNWVATFGAGNTSLSFVNVVTGNFSLSLIQDGVGSRTITWPASVKWVGGTAPTLSTGAGKRDVLTFFCDGTNFYEQSRALDVR